MTIVNGNAKRYIYYHHYYFSNVLGSILKWYVITIRMEIIFCRSGGSEVILMVPHPPFRTFFFIRFRTINSAPKMRFHIGARCGSAHLWFAPTLCASDLVERYWREKKMSDTLWIDLVFQKMDEIGDVHKIRPHKIAKIDSPLFAKCPHCLNLSFPLVHKMDMTAGFFYAALNTYYNSLSDNSVFSYFASMVM